MQDPFTSAGTVLLGSRLPASGVAASLLDDHRRRLAAFDRLCACAAECGIGTDQDRDLVTLEEGTLGLLENEGQVWGHWAQAIGIWRELVPLCTLDSFGFLAEGDDVLEEPNSRMVRIGGGVEAWVFLSKPEESLYKFYRPAEGPNKRIGSTFAFDWSAEGSWLAEACPGSYRDLFEKFLLIAALGGAPMEVMAVTPEGIVVVKQARGRTLEQGEDVSQRLPAGLIEIPSRFLRANRDHPRLFFYEEQPYLVADLHSRNFVSFGSKELKVIDLVAAAWPRNQAKRDDPGINQWLRRVQTDPGAGLLEGASDAEL